ncbi:putative membrane protein [Brucella thiophenivorans]|uniref:Putative membrane protein n=1 Tax=Brucella thiophenivorans TaxID=571255 RepID=A0A256FDX1_9HYPH|nr:putative membrane protein [Brucella thiophenivorans]
MTGVSFAIPELSVLVSLTITSLALYMGGHTVKDVWGKK